MNTARRPTVEALIVSYETRELLRQTISTLLSHAPPPAVAELSVAVFDNASTDGSADMLECEFPSVRLVRSGENIGFAAANNALAHTSGASHVLLLNSDVVVIEDIVTPLLAGLVADPLAVIAGPRLTFPDGVPQYSSQELPTLRVELARSLHGTRVAIALRPLFDTAQVLAASRQHALLGVREPRRTPFLWATCWLIARDEIVRHGLFDERYNTYDEDLDFCRRLQRRGRTPLYVPRAHLVHLGGSSSSSAAKQAMMHRGRGRYFREHNGRLSALVYHWLTSWIAALKRMRADRSR